MFKKISTLVILIMLSTATTILAKDTPVTFTWTPNTDSTVGYNLYMDSGTNKVGTVNGIDTNTMPYTITDSEKCHSFALQAFDQKGVVSDLSEFVVWCPPKTILQIPDRYIITIGTADGS